MLIESSYSIAKESRDTIHKHDPLNIWMLEHKNSIDVARQSGFIVRAFVRFSKNKPELVILLGETHIKTKFAHEVGSKFLEKYNVFGIEGIFLHKYIGGRLLEHTLFKMQKSLALLLKGQSNISSLETNYHKQGQQDLDIYLDNIKTDLKIVGLKHNKYNILLESNHHPSLYGQIFSVATPLALLAWFPAVINQFYGHKTFNKIVEITYTSFLTLSLISAPYGIIWDRDKIMAKNLAESFKFDKLFEPKYKEEQKNQLNTICGIMGLLHISGVGKELRKYGFENLPL